MQCCSALYLKLLGKMKSKRRKSRLTFNRFLFKCWRLHVAARFPGCCEAGITQCHVDKCGVAELRTDLISSKMLNHKVIRRWQASASHSSWTAVLVASKLVCLPCSIMMWKVTSMVGSCILAPPRTSLDQRKSCASNSHLHWNSAITHPP